MKTIKQWFKRVADPKLREELLANMVKAHVQVRSLSEAIAEGVRWNKIAQNGQNYWNIIHFRAFNNQIELLPDKPKIKKSDLLKRIEDLEKVVETLNTFMIDPEPEPEQKIVLDRFIKDNGETIRTREYNTDSYKHVEEMAKIGDNQYIFKVWDSRPDNYIRFIGHYE